MFITRLQLRKFKCINDVSLELASTNVLVGGNNSGKSSVLQGIHFTICAAIASRLFGRDTFPQSALLYCPAEDFVYLRSGEPYLNQSNFGYLNLNIDFPDTEEADYQIRIYRGRNEGNVGCGRTGHASLHAIIANPLKLFSIYVPGLAGIPRSEDFRSESVIRRGVAGGDANLYLRNVLLLIKHKDRLEKLSSLMKSVFPNFNIEVIFDNVADIYIHANLSHTGTFGVKYPLELAGTGVLQALQIFSYITLFEPALLLLDEPDAHLHPDNQGLLATTLQTISLETDTQVILSTHSRHLLEALHEEANFVWLKGGKVIEQGIGIPKLPLLLDLGALDSFDRLQAGAIKWVILSEDSKLNLIKVLLRAAGFNLAETEIYSYKASSNIQSAIALCEFILDAKPGTRVIIHRDRDFMTANETAEVAKKIEEAGANAFITSGSDLEAYFVTPTHLSAILQDALEALRNWLDELATEKHNALLQSFIRKRDEVKFSLYRGKHDSAPDTSTLAGDSVPLQVQNRLGKTMLKLVRTGMQIRFGKTVDPVCISDVLACPELATIRTAGAN